MYNYIAKDGIAQAKFLNGDTFHGEYRHGKRHGRGVYTYVNGAKYDGEYRAGKKEGKGRFTYPDGGVYEGEVCCCVLPSSCCVSASQFIPTLAIKTVHASHIMCVLTSSFLTSPKTHLSIPSIASPSLLTLLPLPPSQFKNDKREGRGRYTYPNTDEYNGEWREDKKHGVGTYTYKSGSEAVIKGVWGNGSLMHGSWIHADGTSFNGQFLGSVPKGQGLFTFPSGLTEAGKFDGGKWVREGFKAPPPSTLPKGPVSAKPFTQACRLVDKAVFKADQFENTHVMKKSISGAPNFRQAGESRVFGLAQPTLSGLQAVIEHIQSNNIADSIAWVSLREEPCAYVGDQSLHPRDRKQINDKLPIDVAALTTEELALLDERFALRLQADIRWRGEELQYFRESFAEVAAERKNVEQSSKEVEPIRSLAGTIEALAEQGYAIELHRAPIPSDSPPNPKQLDALLERLRETDPNSALVFCSRTGRSRSTVGMVTAQLYTSALNGDDNEEEEMEYDEVDDEGEERKREPPKPEYDPLAPNYSKGQFECVMRLVNLMKNGTKVKKEVDKAIDACADVENLREIIINLKARHDDSAPELRRLVWEKAVSYLQRYMHMFLLYQYVREQSVTDFEKPYSQWLLEPEIKDLVEEIGSANEGPLAEFKWE